MIGRSLAHYQITGKLGEGGMGVVYRGHDARLKRDVAVKILPEDFARDAERLGRFRREAETLASMNHARIGAIYGLEEADGEHFLVLELVEGEDLAARMAQGPIPVEEACRLAAQVAEGLEAAHARGVVHRDLKPANIRLDADGDAKVLDFGLSFQSDPNAKGPEDSSEDAATVTSFRESGAVVGTLPYMSPEQARGRAVDERTDCWAFGVILFEMLSGRALFHGETPADALAAVLGKQIPWGELPDNTPPIVRRLLERCLERDPRLRLRQISYARLVIEDGLRAPGDSGGDVAGRRRPWLPAAVGGLALVVGAVAGVLWLAPQPEQVELPHRVASVVTAGEGRRVRMSHGPQISPDGRSVVYVADDQLWVWDLDELDPRPLEGTEGAVGPFWSPDSEQLGYSLGNSFFRIPRRGGRAVTMAVLGTDHGNTPGGGSAWSSNGTVAVGTTYSALLQFSAAGGEVRELLPLAPGDLDAHTVSNLPDGRGWVMAMHKDHGEGSLVVLEAGGERHDVLDIPGDSFGGVAWSPSGHILFTRLGLAEGIWALPFSLETMSATAEPFVVVTNGRNPSVSADGTLAYFRASDSPASRMGFYDRQGNALEGLGVVRANYPFPALSADGRRVLIQQAPDGQRDVYVYDADSGLEQRLTFDPDIEMAAAWGPDGTSFLVVMEAGYKILEISLDGRGEPRELGQGFYPNFTPDGTELVYARAVYEPAFSSDIVRQPYDGGPEDAQVVVATEGIDWSPKVSPDGRWLLYASATSGVETVYLTSYPEGRGRWQVSRGGLGTYPHWRADMREIFYTSMDSLYSVPVELEGGVRLGRPRALFARPSIDWSTGWPDGYDVTPDGQRFLMLEPAPDQDPPLRVVVEQNWWAGFAGAGQP